jgi:type III restriction enzyme
MLTEGWDANNVTHVLGIRAFRSQLLCEQVVGRGLRRMSYEPDPETGKLRAEFVDVYGIPFSLIPFKGKAKEEKEKADPVYHSIFPVPERSRWEMRVPEVEGYVYELRDQGIRCDVASLDIMLVEETVGTTWLRPTKGYVDSETIAHDESDWVEQTREEYYQSVRPQQVVFRLAQRLLEELTQGERKGNDAAAADLRFRARHQLFPELVGIVQRYIRERVQFKPGLDARELGLELYSRKLIERIRDGILPAAARPGRLIPVVNRFHSNNTTADISDHTTRRVLPVTRSHLNCTIIRSNPEAEAVEIMEDMRIVDHYAPNMRGLLIVPYEYGGEPHGYEPDFLVSLTGGKMIMLEIKGEGGRVYHPDVVPAKNAAARKWCDAVSNLGRYGQWAFEICDDVSTLRSQLQKHSSDSGNIPFEVLPIKDVRPWDNAVPLVSLRRIVRLEEANPGLFQEHNFEGEWITWDRHEPFRQGMFVSRVQGADLEPDIAADSYCLFRRATPSEDLDGRIALIRHHGLADRQYGEDWTVRRVSYVEVPANEDWPHREVVLKGVAEAGPSYTFELKSGEQPTCLGVLETVLR